MVDRRAQVMSAALDLLGEGGPKSMTHRAVDRAAGTPLGTAANHFPTADALIQAVAAELQRLDTELWQVNSEPTWSSPDDAARDIARFARSLTQPPQRNLTRARILLSLTHPETVGAAHQRLRTFFGDAIRTSLGLELEPRTVTTLAGLIDGLVLHHVTVSTEPLDELALKEAVLRLLP